MWGPSTFRGNQMLKPLRVVLHATLLVSLSGPAETPHRKAVPCTAVHRTSGTRPSAFR